MAPNGPLYQAPEEHATYWKDKLKKVKNGELDFEPEGELKVQKPIHHFFFIFCFLWIHPPNSNFIIIIIVTSADPTPYLIHSGLHDHRPLFLRPWETWGDRLLSSEAPL